MPAQRKQHVARKCRKCEQLFVTDADGIKLHAEACNGKTETPR